MAATAYQSRDEHWRVTVISRDGKQLIRLEHDTFLHDGQGAPVFTDWEPAEGKRAGSYRTAHGYLWGDFRTVEEIARFVALKDLRPVEGS